MAPNQPDPENIALNIRMNRILRAKLDKYIASLPRKANKKEQETASSLLRQMLEEKVAHVQLSKEEMNEIAADIQKAKSKIKNK
jgi:hypothetical protein